MSSGEHDSPTHGLLPAGEKEVKQGKVRWDPRRHACRLKEAVASSLSFCALDHSCFLSLLASVFMEHRTCEGKRSTSLSHSHQLLNPGVFIPTSLFDEAPSLVRLGERFLSHWCLTLGLVMVLGIKTCCSFKMKVILEKSPHFCSSVQRKT